MASEEKEHPATAKQRAKFIDDGDIARSRDLAAAVAIATSLLVFMLWRQPMVNQLAHGMQQVLRQVAQPADFKFFRAILHLFAQLTAPFFIANMGSAILLSYWQNGWSIPWRGVKFNWSMLNFMPRLLRLLRLGENAKNMLAQTLKMVVLAWVCLSVMRQHIPALVSHVPGSILAGYQRGASLLVTLLQRAVLTYGIIGLLDYSYNHYRLEKRMRMSTQEIKDEAKDQSGDGRIKSRIRAMHNKIVMQRSLQQVPEADVVVVNPTHYAVALLYRDNEMEAPSVVAKGADVWAERIRAMARSHGVPVVSQPALARALFAQVEVSQPIPHALYQAVALVLAHVYKYRPRRH